jgi:cell division septation protein DedD
MWNGYTADQPLENYVHGEIEGGIIYTTGDGQYIGRFMEGTEYGTYYDVNYDLDIPGNAKLARLYIYHTWSKPDHTAPKIGVTLKTPSDDVHELNMKKSYNDIKGDFGAWWYVWGTYAYNITEYVKENGIYTVTVTNLNSGSDDDFATEYAFAAPAIFVVYEDTTAPKREYWVNEGADILLGGRRGDGGFLALDECLNSATFDGEHQNLEVEKAALGVVSPWGDDEKNVLYFKSEAQVGIAAFDVTYYLEDCDNEVIQVDDGDNMMPTNAFLVITYEEEDDEDPPDIIPQEPVDTEINNIEGESRTFAISIDQTVDIVWQLNGTEVQTDEDVTEACYTNASAVLGTWDVSAIGTSRETGLSGIHTWIWNVTAAVGTTPTSAVNITSTPSPTPTPTATPASSVSATPTPTPTPTTATPRPGEKKKAEAEETKAPGFELVMSSFILIAVAYLLRKRRKL